MVEVRTAKVLGVSAAASRPVVASLAVAGLLGVHAALALLRTHVRRRLRALLCVFTPASNPRALGTHRSQTWRTPQRTRKPQRYTGRQRRRESGAWPPWYTGDGEMAWAPAAAASLGKQLSTGGQTRKQAAATKADLPSASELGGLYPRRVRWVLIARPKLQAGRGLQVKTRSWWCATLARLGLSHRGSRLAHLRVVCPAPAVGPVPVSPACRM